VLQRRYSKWEVLPSARLFLLFFSILDNGSKHNFINKTLLASISGVDLTSFILGVGPCVKINLYLLQDTKVIEKKYRKVTFHDLPEPICPKYLGLQKTL
jgi:hypothetical protein